MEELFVQITVDQEEKARSAVIAPASTTSPSLD